MNEGIGNPKVQQELHRQCHYVLRVPEAFSRTCWGVHHSIIYTGICVETTFYLKDSILHRVAGVSNGDLAKPCRTLHT